MKKRKILTQPHKFITCGLTGWCLEILYTAFYDEIKCKSKTPCENPPQNINAFTGHTSLWMFPIYGSIVCLSPLCRLLKGKKLWLRGFTYMSIIFTGEYFSGCFLKAHHACPWDYSHARANINGVIRLDYAPLWFFTGLLFEKILRQSN